MTRPTRSDRIRMGRRAQEIRMSALREGLDVEATVDRITRDVPDMFSLEAWRIANGWHRPEVSAQLDALYQADGLAQPRISDAELCRWEHEQRRPGDERIEYLCRLYKTRPDQLGYGRDFSETSVGHLQHTGLVDVYPRTNDEAEHELRERIRTARKRINMFGLTRNFYARDDVLPLFEARAQEIPVTFYVMDPFCDSRRDRYRLEPSEASMEDPERYSREVIRPLLDAQERVSHVAAEGAGLRMYTFNFPCAFAIEEIDDVCRVMLYGHGKRGTEGPIFIYQEGTPYHEYFASQIRWLERLAHGTREPWLSRRLTVESLVASDPRTTSNLQADLEDWI